jgi:hypothetical protein
MTWNSPRSLAVVAVTLGGLQITLVALTLRRQREFMSATLQKQAGAQSYQVKMLNGMETLKAMGVEQTVVDRRGAREVGGQYVHSRRQRRRTHQRCVGFAGTQRTHQENNRAHSKHVVQPLKDPMNDAAILSGQSYASDASFLSIGDRND